MGCSQSTQVIEHKKIQNKTIQKVEHFNNQKTQHQQKLNVIPQRGQCFLIGSLNQSEQIFAHVNLQKMQINKMSIPIDFKCKNFCSILELQNGKYSITGGINHNLTDISSEFYIYSSDTHTAQKFQNMIQPRYTHVSLFYDGQLYVIGGRYYGDDKTAILNTCQKFSFESKMWVEMPKLNIKRCTCFSFVWNHSIYVVGGYTGPYQRSTKIQKLDKITNQWILLDIQLNRGLEGAILLPTNDNQITIFGGLANSGPTNSVITINLKDQTIRSKKALSEKRSLYKSFYKNGKVHIFGGDDNFTLQVYDIVGQQSVIISKQQGIVIQEFDNLGFSTATVTVPYSTVQRKLMAPVYSDQIVLILGTTQQPFLCQLNISIPSATFYEIPLQIKLHAYQGGIQLSKDKILLFGGIQDDSLSVVSSDVYQYCFRQHKARKVNRMNQNRYAFAYQKTISNGSIQYLYCFGGATSNAQGKLVFLSACQRYSLQNNKWQLISPLPQKLISPMSLIFKQNIFVFGGTNQKHEKAKQIYKYNQKQDLWACIDFKLPFGLQAGSITKVNQNQFFVFGGRVQNGQSAGIWSLYLNEIKNQKKKLQTTCVFQQKSQMNEPKSLHKIYKPNHQDFYVIFGGDKHPLTCYKSKDLKQQTSDLLINMKEMFIEALNHLNHKNLKGYLIVDLDSKS